MIYLGPKQTNIAKNITAMNTLFLCPITVAYAINAIPCPDCKTSRMSISRTSDIWPKTAKASVPKKEMQLLYTQIIVNIYFSPNKL